MKKLGLWLGAVLLFSMLSGCCAFWWGGCGGYGDGHRDRGDHGGYGEHHDHEGDH